MSAPPAAHSATASAAPGSFKRTGAALARAFEDSPEHFFWALCGVQVFLWTLLPGLSFSNAPLDVVENIGWGREWQWGYYKHPPLQAWLTEAFFTLSNGPRPLLVPKEYFFDEESAFCRTVLFPAVQLNKKAPETGAFLLSGAGRKIGVPYGIRTRVTSVKGTCPRPLDEGDVRASSSESMVIRVFPRERQAVFENTLQMSGFKGLIHLLPGQEKHLAGGISGVQPQEGQIRIRILKGRAAAPDLAQQRAAGI